MLESVRKTIREQNLFEQPGVILAAVSGGADSTAMLYALIATVDSKRNPIAVVHIHHGLRANEADDDAAFVQQTAWSLGLFCHVMHVDVPALVRRSGLSLEMAARQLRYEALHSAAESTGARYAALGHNSDDQVETVLMRLLRGAGLRGLGGIRMVRRDGALILVRPLLHVSHQAAVSFLQSHQLSWCEDSSNRESDMLRNRVRHELLPICEGIYPSCRKSILRTAELLQAEEEWRTQAGHSCEGAAILDADSLRSLSSAEQRRVILQWLAESGMEMQKIRAAHVKSIESLAASSDGTQTVDLPGEMKVYFEYGKLRLGGQSLPIVHAREPLFVPGITCVKFADCCIEAVWAKGVLRPENQRIGVWPAVASIRLRPELDGGVIVRNRRPGDWMVPQGCRGRKKIQDIFVDQKVPRAKRDRIPLVECDGEIIWIPGYRVAENWTVQKGADALHLRVVDRALDRYFK